MFVNPFLDGKSEPSHTFKPTGLVFLGRSMRQKPPQKRRHKRNRRDFISLVKYAGVWKNRRTGVYYA